MYNTYDCITDVLAILTGLLKKVQIYCKFYMYIVKKKKGLLLVHDLYYVLQV